MRTASLKCFQGNLPWILGQGFRFFIKKFMSKISGQRGEPYGGETRSSKVGRNTDPGEDHVQTNRLRSWQGRSRPPKAGKFVLKSLNFMWDKRQYFWCHKDCHFFIWHCHSDIVTVQKLCDTLCDTRNMDPKMRIMWLPPLISKSLSVVCNN